MSDQPATTDRPFTVHLRDVFVRRGRALALGGVSLDIRPGQHWAFVGANGSGKTTLMQLIRAEVHPAQWATGGKHGQRLYDFGGGPTASPVQARVHCAAVSADAQDDYVRMLRDLDAETVILTGFTDSPLPNRSFTAPERARAARLMAELGMEHLRGRGFLGLSRGQARLVLLARALVTSPRLLILDEALDGLDASAKKHILRAMDSAAARGTQILLTTHHHEHIPAFVTHAAVLEGGTIHAAGPIAEILPAPQPGSPLPPPQGASSRTMPPSPRQDFLLDMRGVQLIRNAATLLQDVSWTVLPGQHWAVLGGNGAGKTTLMTLAAAQMRPSRGSVDWFGKRGRVDIWSVRQRIGLVSPELQAGYRYNISAEDFVVSGFFSSVGLYARASAKQQRSAAQRMAQVGLADAARTPIRSLSYGQLRRLVIARAMVHTPELLILDEPCAGLDAASRAAFLSAVDVLSATGVTILFVTHHMAELPSALRHAVVLEAGRVVHCGSLADAPALSGP